jgi:hypothetical protein
MRRPSSPERGSTIGPPRPYDRWVPDAEPPEVSPPWRWPAEWAIERAFWREVSSRTIAGVLTLVAVGVPALIYAAASGVLTFDRVAPILIGVGLVLLLGIGYVLALRFIARRERRRIAEVINSSEGRVSITFRYEDLASFSVQQRADIESARKSSLRSTIGTSALTLLSVVVAILTVFDDVAGWSR